MLPCNSYAQKGPLRTVFVGKPQPWILTDPNDCDAAPVYPKQMHKTRNIEERRIRSTYYPESHRTLNPKPCTNKTVPKPETPVLEPYTHSPQPQFSFFTLNSKTLTPFTLKNPEPRANHGNRRRFRRAGLGREPSRWAFCFRLRGF